MEVAVGSLRLISLALLVGLLPVSMAIAVESGARTKRAHQEPVRIAGMPVECTDFRGRAVRTMRVANLGDVGRAWVVNTMPFIIMDVHVLVKLPPKLQLFFYGHECAHHVLGHWVQLSQKSEQEADCWSVKNGRDRGLFSRDEIVGFAPYLRTSKGSPWGHLPGPKRAQFLLLCFDEK